MVIEDHRRHIVQGERDIRHALWRRLNGVDCVTRGVVDGLIIDGAILQIIEHTVNRTSPSDIMFSNRIAQLDSSWSVAVN